MTKLPQPYIGITGFMSQEEVQNLWQMFPEKCTHKLMVGVLANSKTLKGEVQDKRHQKKYPSKEQIPDIFLGKRQGKLLNLLHFNTSNKENLLDELLELVTIDPINCHGAQLNMVWPSIDVLKKFRKTFSQAKLVLQVGKSAQKKCDDDPVKIAKRIREYEGLVDYMLVDPSGGRGEPLDVQKTIEIFAAMEGSFIGRGVAGGLYSKSLDRLDPIIEAGHIFSIDAENKLQMPEGGLNLVESTHYLEESVEKLS